MKIKLDEHGIMPTRAHATDAGIDLYAPFATTILAFDSKIIPIGVHIQLPRGTAGVLMSKSGLNVKHGITSTGLIDEGYTGEIVVKLYNHSATAYSIEKGDKISQLMIVPVLYEDLEQVEKLDDSERGDGGFGSTGK